MMATNLIITQEIPPLPEQREDAHKGEMGRLIVIGGCCNEHAMIGAPSLAANAAFRSGAGLVQLMVPEVLRSPVAILAPCATTRTLPVDADMILAAVDEFHADAIALGPGLGDALDASTLVSVLTGYGGPVVLDADGLNLLAETEPFAIPDPQRIVLTPHPGEMHRLLVARDADRSVERTLAARRAAACALVEAYGCVVVLKGQHTIVTDGERLYTNETGNAGMATGGTGDVLTGVITALIGQKLPALEAAILGVYLHGLAGDFAAEELGRRSVTAVDVVEYLPEAFCEHELTGMD